MSNCAAWAVAIPLALLLLAVIALPIWWLMNTIAGYVAFSYMQAYGVTLAINFTLVVIRNNFKK